MKTFTYTYADLAFILRSCADYIESTDTESIIGYFDEFIDSGLFADAIGKTIGSTVGVAETIVEY